MISPISLWGTTGELTVSTVSLQSVSNITDVMSLPIANFMASSSPKASASGGEEAKCEVFDIPLMSCVTPRFPKQRNNNIFDQSSQQTGMSHYFSKFVK